MFRLLVHDSPLSLSYFFSLSPLSLSIAGMLACILPKTKRSNTALTRGKRLTLVCNCDSSLEFTYCLSVRCPRAANGSRPAFAASGQLPALCLNRFDPPADFHAPCQRPAYPWARINFYFIHSVSRISLCISCRPASTPREMNKHFMPCPSCIPNSAGNRFTLVSACLVAISALLVTSSSALDVPNANSTSLLRPNFSQRWQITANTSVHVPDSWTNASSQCMHVSMCLPITCHSHIIWIGFSMV